ncbi:unnamed protein product [Heterosigma akashiwo]
MFLLTQPRLRKRFCFKFKSENDAWREKSQVARIGSLGRHGRATKFLKQVKRRVSFSQQNNF